MYPKGALAHLARALDWQSKGDEFESRMLHMKTQLLLIALLVLSSTLKAQVVNYSPAYFGPNANPAWEFTDATIPVHTYFSFSEDFFFGFGDNTFSSKLTLEIPLLSERISMKLWVALMEQFKVTEEVSEKRGMNGVLVGGADGDMCIQTRIRLFKEKKIMPNVILNTTLKTASGTNVGKRRYYDTPGYYFDVELGKSVHTKNELVSEIRGAVDLGFLCWQGPYNEQNDAPMYGGKFILSNKLIEFENAIAGYKGWMRNGDNPLVYSSKIALKAKQMSYYLMYQYGIRDFPYHHIRVGFTLKLPEIMPIFNKS